MSWPLSPAKSACHNTQGAYLQQSKPPGQSQPPVMEKTWHQIKSNTQGCILATSSSIPSIQRLSGCRWSNLFLRPDLRKLERGLVLHKYPSYSRNTSSSGLGALCLNCLLMLPQSPCSLWQRSLLHLFSASPNSDKDVRTDGNQNDTWSGLRGLIKDNRCMLSVLQANTISQILGRLFRRMTTRKEKKKNTFTKQIAERPLSTLYSYCNCLFSGSLDYQQKDFPKFDQRAMSAHHFPGWKASCNDHH